MARSSSLHDRTENGEDSCDDQVPATTDLVSDPASSKSTNKTAALEGSDDVGLKISGCDRAQTDKAISSDGCVSSARKSLRVFYELLLLESRHRQDTSNNTAVHSEKHTAKAGLFVLDYV